MTTQSQTSYAGESPVAYRTRRPAIWLPRATLIVVSILILVNLVAALMAAAYQIYYDGLIYPGVSVWGVDVSGLSPAEAAAALNGQFTYPQLTTITFRDGDNIWPVSAAELGVRFDVERTVQAAYEVGRHPRLIPALRQQIQAWRQGVVVSPVLVYDQMAADVRIQQIAAQINRPPVDAAVLIDGLEVSAIPGQIGRQVDVPATFSGLNAVITRLQSGEVPVVVVETPPQVMSAEEAAAQARAILASDLEIYIEGATADDPGPWVASRQALAEMLVIDRVANPSGEGQVYWVHLNDAQLRAFLEPLAPQLAREPVNARFVFDRETAAIEPIAPSIAGRRLDVPASIQLINQSAPTGNHRVPLVFEVIDPAVPDTATAADLGITEMIASATTYFYGSSEGRRANVATAAARFHGIMIAPGEEFSFNRYLGEVSEETGFEEALIIYNGRTIRGVGGGVCQVSTTAFQTAFYAGFPISERWPHGYWVGYYDSGEGKGMDATVYEPLVDLKFTNDTPYWLLIETYTDLAASTLTWKFYSTSDGRTVQKDGPYVSNIVPHGPALYEENPELSPGQTKKVDYAADGFDVVVNRTVYRDGEVLYQDSFFSTYIPWQAIYQVAPGYIPPGAARVGGN